MTSTAYPKSINRQLESIERDKEKTLQLVQVASFAEKLQQDFPELVQGVAVDILFAHSVTVRVFPKVMSDLAWVLRYVRKAGYRMQKDGIHDHPGSSMRSYHLTNNMNIIAHFDTTETNEQNENEQNKGKHCRYVKVGEKREVVVKPVYELQCN